MTEQDIAIREEELGVAVASEISPEQFDGSLVSAHEKAKRVRDIVDKQGLYQKYGNSEHLKAEGWQVLGEAYHFSSQTGTELIRNPQTGVLEGVKSAAIIVDQFGAVRGSADSYCFGSEKGKENHTAAQWAGMAQTRAASRAFKQALSWVAVLAGYSPTPAEEMDGIYTDAQVENATSKEHWCEKHKAYWKLTRRGTYGHPIAGTKAADGNSLFCNEPSSRQAPAKENGGGPDNGPVKMEASEFWHKTQNTLKLKDGEVEKLLHMSPKKYMETRPDYGWSDVYEHVVALIEFADEQATNHQKGL
jgi:hypothetical protein